MQVFELFALLGLNTDNIEISGQGKRLVAGAFADKCGIQRAHMSLIERGRQNLTLATLENICRNLGVTMSEALKGVG